MFFEKECIRQDLIDIVIKLLQCEMCDVAKLFVRTLVLIGLSLNTLLFSSTEAIVFLFSGFDETLSNKGNGLNSFEAICDV